MTSYQLRAVDNDLCGKVKGLCNVGMVMAYLKFTKEGNSQKLLHQLKYRNKPQLAEEIGKYVWENSERKWVCKTLGCHNTSALASIETKPKRL